MKQLISFFNVQRLSRTLLLFGAAFAFFIPYRVDAQIGNIFGGMPIDISEAPYQVSLEYGVNGSSGHGCGGSIPGQTHEYRAVIWNKLHTFVGKTIWQR